MVRNSAATVLVYTLMLVTLSVFIADVILNISLELSRSFRVEQISKTIINIIKTKAELSFKYSREINGDGWWFVDNISCPQSVTLSTPVLNASPIVTPGISTSLARENDSLYCLSSQVHQWKDLKILFKDDFTDIAFAQYDGYYVSVNQNELSAVFADSAGTQIDIWSQAYLSSDGVDDNFNSDDYTVGSSIWTYYPDAYIDNDVNARLEMYGFITSDSGLYNIFWSHDELWSYIEENSNNTDSVYGKLSKDSLSEVLLYLEFDQEYRLVLYRVDKDRYNATRELIMTEKREGISSQPAIWYLQDDAELSLSSEKTGNEYVFDIAQYDYILFVENLTTEELLLYRVRAEENLDDGKQLYINPIKDDDMALLSYFGTHVYINEEGRLIWESLEIFDIK